MTTRPEGWLREGERAVCGMDMGTLHLAWCVVAYRPTVAVATLPNGGRGRTLDELVEDVRPAFRVVSWRLTNLECNAVYGSYDAPAAPSPECVASSWSTGRNYLPPVPTDLDDTNGNKPQLTTFVFRALARQLRRWACLRDLGDCPVYIEQQVDHVLDPQRRNAPPVMFALSKAHVAAIEQLDDVAGRPLLARPSHMTAKKAGVARGGGAAVDKAHKDASIAQMHALLQRHGDAGAAAFLDTLKTLKWKLDDPADALNMAVEHALQDLRAAVKEERAALPPAPRKRKRPATDDADADTRAAKKVKTEHGGVTPASATDDVDNPAAKQVKTVLTVDADSPADKKVKTVHSVAVDEVMPVFAPV